MQFARSLSKTLAALSLLPLLAACTHSLQTAASSDAERVAAALNSKVVARVNGQEITAAELNRAERIVMANKRGLQIPPTLQKEFEQQVLNQLVSSELLFQASQKLEFKDLDQQAEAKLSQIKKGFAKPEDFAASLDQIGMDEPAFVKSVRRDLAIARLVNSTIADKITVSEAEIKKFYEENPATFRTPEQVRASHILIGIDPKGGMEAKKAAHLKAEQIRAELVKGADFATLAKEKSTCSSSKQGGDLGFFGKGRMDPGFEKVAFALKPGELSEVVETRFGYHVIKLVERKPSETIPFAAARQKIEDYLKGQKTTSAVEAFVGTARGKAKIELL
ncbi:peptidylprolyl isomerase [Geomesophilobacter sediminis]|uniref:Peptidylprolyl isomerase n=1 Tax=Geomesophilobacter sediminis TaxID=2798584 RepID=A0A8J7JM37_9BACT|nr:peptidylprolyl isomerase [Geomesophilobacter sediminis]MBJ6725480.1 peptidylprolyl isomerase [Geomesophilobacter sediminis]